MITKRRTNRQCAKRRATAVVEAAVVLPVVVLLTFGFIEIGAHVDNLQVLHNAARQGARAAVRTYNSNGEVQAAVLNALSNSGIPTSSGVTVKMYKLTTAGQQHYQVMDLSENEEGHAIRVTVTVDPGVLPLPSNFFGFSARSSSSTAVMQRSTH